jgi:hypothetical protein
VFGYVREQSAGQALAKAAGAMAAAGMLCKGWAELQQAGGQLRGGPAQAGAKGDGGGYRTTMNG